MLRIPWLALGAGAYIVFALALFPAATVYRWFAPDSVRLSGIEGTLWSGQAALGSVGELGLHDIRWRLSPLNLLAGRLSGELETRLADGFLNTQLSAGLGGVVFSELQATASLPTLKDVVPVGATQGLASLQLERLALQNGWPEQAVGQIQLAEVAVAPFVPTGGLISMGSYRLTFLEGDGDGVRGQIEDLGGPLEVNATVRLDPDRGYLIEGLARARPEATPELVQGLQLISSEPDSSGLRAFNLSGSL